MKWEKEEFKEKRFWLFMYSDYQAQGGLDDLHSSYDTLEDAKKIASDYPEDINISIYDSQEQVFHWVVRKPKPIKYFIT